MRDLEGFGPVSSGRPHAKLNSAEGRGLEDTEGISSTSDTSHLSQPSQVGGCPCGRSHPDTRRSRAPANVGPAFHGKTVEEAHRAYLRGKAEPGQGEVTLHYAGRCERPVRMSQVTFEHLRVHRELRCRKCPDCLRARTWYWALAGVEETRRAQEAGQRTWFGTLTYSTEAQNGLVRRAREAWLSSATGPENSDFWEDPLCDYRFEFVRREVVLDIQRYWKRLRKAGHQLRYLVVIERHMGTKRGRKGAHHGLPHIHWLVHETSAPIRKRQLEAHWPFGHAKVTIVGGRSKRAARPEKAAWYVVKYLQKSVQARQMASQTYRPARRNVDASSVPEA